MTGAAIAAQVTAALREASFAAGNGVQAVLIRPAPQPVDPWDAPADAPTQTPSVWAISEAYSAGQIDGTVIRAEDRRVMVEPVTPAPTTADRLQIGGLQYAIVRVDPEAPGGVALYHVCQCRR